MISKAKNTIDKYKMLINTKKVAVGFSGGADSTALLHFLYFFVSECGKNFDVIAVHVNHNLRGEESVRDEKFVRNFCKKYNINLIVKQAEIRKISEENKIGLEEAGRMVRYKIFEEIASGENCKIATAHTLSDSAETLIMNLTRGCGLKGLCGIPPIRRKIIRPLINVTRAEIEAYCKEHNLAYIHDSTNFQKDYTRNKIRLDVIPYLKSINPEFENAVGRMLETVRSEERYLEMTACKIFNNIKKISGFYVSEIDNWDEALKNRIIFKIINNFTKKIPEQKHITDVLKIIKNPKKEVCLPGNVSLVCKNNILKIKDNEKAENSLWEVPVKDSNILTSGETNIIIKVIPVYEYRNQKISKKIAFDYDKLPENSVFRNRRSGDIFKLPFRNVTKSVKKLFNELKIPKEKRNSIPMIACGNDVIWIDKIGVSKNYIIDKNTVKVAIIFKEQKNGYN